MSNWRMLIKSHIDMTENVAGEKTHEKRAETIEALMCTEWMNGRLL